MYHRRGSCPGSNSIVLYFGVGGAICQWVLTALGWPPPVPGGCSWRSRAVALYMFVALLLGIRLAHYRSCIGGRRTLSPLAAIILILR
jgi:hypothetical protein